jgi:transposase InsO family protein
VNKKRVHRWYRLEGLQLRMRVRRRKHMCLHRGPVPQAQRTHERWSMDFVHDQLANERPFKGRLRDECLNVMQFESLEDARAKIEAWRIDYNAHRPHSSLGNLTPSEFAMKRHDQRPSEVVNL